MSAPTCEVWVDGAKAAQTPDGLHVGEPTLLDGLSFSWGRASALEQPDVATCSFTIRDQFQRGSYPSIDVAYGEGGYGTDDYGGVDRSRTILDVIHVGSKIAIWSEGVIPARPDRLVYGQGVYGESDYGGGELDVGAETMLTGSFETTPLGPLPATSWTPAGRNSSGLAVDVVEEPGARAVRLTRTTKGAAPYQLVFPPEPFQPEGLNPAAWDSVPKLFPGDTWQFSMRLRMLPNNRAQAIFAGLSSPWPSVATVGGALVSSQWVRPSTDGYVEIYGTVQMREDGPQNGLWVAPGVAVTVPSSAPWASLSGPWDTAQDRWSDYQGVWIDNLSIVAPTQTRRRVLVLSCEVTDLAGVAAGDHAVQITATAADIGGRLGNDTIGDEPWPIETVQDRSNRIRGLARTKIPMTIDTTLRATPVAQKDVDSQPVQGLLQDLAQTAGGVLWAATHGVTGPYLRIEDPRNRSAVRGFADVDGKIKIIDSGRGFALVSAADILRDPVTWKQSVADVVTAVEVGWMELGPPDPETGDRASIDQVTRVADEATIAAPNGPGLRLLQVSTELTNAVDAEAMADRLLASARQAGWRVDGYTLDTRTLRRANDSVADWQRRATVMDLLDGTTRNGMAVELIDVPPYTPAGAVASGYVEGGTYTYEGGYWSLDLTISPSLGQGASAQWRAFDHDWSWSEFDSSISWADAFGTAATV